MKTYNINELLDKKKELQTQVAEGLNIDNKELEYRKEVHTDLNNPANIKTFENRTQVTLNEYSQKMYGMLEELSKIKTAISKFNADNISELLYERESARNRIEYLNRIKTGLRKDKQVGRNITRQTADGVALEVADIEVRGMFPYEDVEKQLNEIAAEERKLNTQIQKINLQAEIEL